MFTRTDDDHHGGEYNFQDEDGQQQQGTNVTPRAQKNMQQSTLGSFVSHNNSPARTLGGQQLFAKKQFCTIVDPFCSDFDGDDSGDFMDTNNNTNGHTNKRKTTQTTLDQPLQYVHIHTTNPRALILFLFCSKKKKKSQEDEPSSSSNNNNNNNNADRSSSAATAELTSVQNLIDTIDDQCDPGVCHVT